MKSRQHREHTKHHYIDRNIFTSGTYREDPTEDLAFHSPETSFTTQRRTRWKIEKNTSGEDVSFTSRISQLLTNSSQALRMASASSSRLCRSSYSKISQNSLELEPFSLQNLLHMQKLQAKVRLSCMQRLLKKKCQTPPKNQISSLNRWVGPCSRISGFWLSMLLSLSG